MALDAKFFEKMIPADIRAKLDTLLAGAQELVVKTRATHVEVQELKASHDNLVRLVQLSLQENKELREFNQTLVDIINKVPSADLPAKVECHVGK